MFAFFNSLIISASQGARSFCSLVDLKKSKVNILRNFKR